MKKIILIGTVFIPFIVLFGQPAPGGFALYNTTNTNTVTLFSGITTSSYNILFPLVQGAASSLLSNDGAGNLTWVPGGNASTWTILGNAGVSGSNNFLGTTDATTLTFRTNNSFAGQIGATSATTTAYGRLSGMVGNFSTYIGTSSGKVSTASSFNNVGVGSTTFFSNTASANNTVLGTGALTTLTSGAGNNVIVGYSSGGGITTGSGNTIVGSFINGLAGTLTNQIIIADGAGGRRIQVNAAGQLTMSALPNFVGSVPSPAGAIVSDKVVTTDGNGNVGSLAAPLFTEVIRGKAICPPSSTGFTAHSNTAYDTPDFQVISTSTSVGGSVSGSTTTNTYQVVVYQYLGAPLTTTTDAYGFVSTYRVDTYTDLFSSIISQIANSGGYTQISVNFSRMDVIGGVNWGSGPSVSIMVVR